MSVRPAPDAIAASIVGTTVGPVAQALDARWLMAYAAGLGERDGRYYDTLAAGGPLAHPLFPVCYEWPVALALRDRTIAAALQPLSVHATHHLVIHRLPRAGDSLRTTARVIAVEPRRAGTLVTSRFETLSATGEMITTTDYGSVYRGVALAPSSNEDTATGSAAPSLVAPPAGSQSRWTEVVEVDANAARVYTECARIWNPIHTDVAVARRAGLSAPILHGTATLALAISRVLARDLGGEPERVGEIRGRFTGMVALPSTFTVRGGASDDRNLTFDAIGADGAPVLSYGFVAVLESARDQPSA